MDHDPDIPSPRELDIRVNDRITWRKFGDDGAPYIARGKVIHSDRIQVVAREYGHTGFDTMVRDEVLTVAPPPPTGPREAELNDAAATLAATMVRAIGDGDVRVGAAKDSAEAQRQRVSKLLRKSRLEAKEEAEREAAQLEIKKGTYVNVGDAVVPPTPEWLAKHEHRNVTVSGEGFAQGTHTRSVKTVRRVIVTPVIRAHRAGHIDERQLRACTWYADRYEQTGLDGRMAKGCFEPRIASGLMGGVAFTDRQVEAMDDMRAVRKAIRANWRKFFDLVVLNEIGVKRAERMAKCRRDSGMLTLRTCADQVADWLGL